MSAKGFQRCSTVSYQQTSTGGFFPPARQADENTLSPGGEAVLFFGALGRHCFPSKWPFNGL